MADRHELIQRQRKKLRKLVRKAPFVLSQMVVTANPVDTGHSRANWFAGINAKGTQSFDTVTPKLKLGDKYYFTNSVSYVIYLEQGSSTQAPNGMVKTSVAAWPQIVKEIWRANK